MAGVRRFDLDDLLIRPGTYFNPQTEVLLIVDDSPQIDPEIFGAEQTGGAEWMLISDESPIDEPRRDELLEQFQVTYQEVPSTAVEGDEAETVDEDDEEDLGGVEELGD